MALHRVELISDPPLLTQETRFHKSVLNLGPKTLPLLKMFWLNHNELGRSSKNDQSLLSYMHSRCTAVGHQQHKHMVLY